MRNKLLFGIAGVVAAFGTAGCALLSGRADGPDVHVAANERLYVRVLPFDSVATHELTRSGIDPVALEEEFRSEIRYRLFLRKQEAALDSAGAAVVVDVKVRHLQPGFGNAGTFAAFTLISRRAGGSGADTATWSFNALARENVPEPHTSRHLSRLAAHEVLARIKPPPKENESAPPLHLMR